MLKAKTTSSERLEIVARHHLNVKIAKTEAVHRLYVIQDSPRKILIGDDIVSKHFFVTAYPVRWVWLNREWIPTKTVAALVVDYIEEAYMVGEVAEKVLIPIRSGKRVSVVAPDNVEGKVVGVMPKGKIKDYTELLLANSVDEVVDGMVPAWVVNTTEREVEIDLFEGLAEVAECAILEAGDNEDMEEGEESFEIRASHCRMSTTR